MCCKNKCNSSYFTNLASAARQNSKERYTVVKGDYMKVNVMSIAICGEIGAEVHEGEDQLITVVCGTATVKYGRTQCTADCVRQLNAGESVFIPAGTWHNVCNTGSGLLKLISTYGYAGRTCMHNNGVAGVQSVGCGCLQNTEVAQIQTTGGGCAQALGTVRGTVFDATDYNWNTIQTQDNGCSCQINSGC